MPAIDTKELYKALSHVPRGVQSNDRAVKRFVNLLDETVIEINDSLGELAEIGTLIADSATVPPAASGVTKNITSISLPLGEWDVTGAVSFAGGTFTFFQGGSSPTSATLVTYAQFYYTTPSFNPAALNFTIPTVRYTAPGPGNLIIYLVGNITYTVAPTSMAGAIRATKMG